MKALIEFVKTTIIGGLLVILPVGLSIVLLMKAVGAVLVIVGPVAAQLPTGTRFATFIALFVIMPDASSPAC